MRTPRASEGFPGNGRVEEDWVPSDSGPGPYDLMTGAGVLGARAWFEQELHVLVGAWSTEVDDARLAVAFGRLAMHHAARAAALIARLPNLRELPAAALVAAGGPETRRLIRLLAGQPDGESAAGSDRTRVSAWLAVAGGLLDAYRDHLVRTSEVADAPLRRCLPVMIAGLEDDVAGLLGAGAVSAPGSSERDDDQVVRETVRDTVGFLE